MGGTGITVAERVLRELDRGEGVPARRVAGRPWLLRLSVGDLGLAALASQSGRETELVRVHDPEGISGASARPAAADPRRADTRPAGSRPADTGWADTGWADTGPSTPAPAGAQATAGGPELDSRRAADSGPGHEVHPACQRAEPGRLAELLEESGVPADLASLLSLAMPALKQESPSQPQGRGSLAADECLDALKAMRELTSRIDQGRLLTARELTARAGEALLTKEHQATRPEELSDGAREDWRARSKSVTVREIEALTGLGRLEAQALVGLANAPRAALDPAMSGLQSGVANWRHLRAFWDRCPKLPHEQAAEVAQALFGNDRDTVAAERLTPEGELSEEPWRIRKFYNALDRECMLQEGRDPETEREARRRRRRARDAFGVVDDDGTGRLVATGDVATVAAATDRLCVIARRARQAGDKRTEKQIRSDLLFALVLRGTLALPELPEDESLINEDDARALAQVLAGAPSAELQVVTPLDALISPELLAALAEVLGEEIGTEGQHAEPTHPGREGGGCSWSGEPGEPAAPSAVDRKVGAGGVHGVGVGVGAGEVGDRASPPERVRLPGCTTPAESPGCTTPADVQRGLPAKKLLVGQILGRFPQFLSAAAVRELARWHDTTLFRLITDPLDGRCVERSVAGYVPDRAMRQQLRAADVFSRVPGSMVPARDCDLDHVEEHILGGPTSELNLSNTERSTHVLKTRKLWDCWMDSSRNLTWVTLFERVYRTRVHDYRQYVRTGVPRTSPQGLELTGLDAPSSLPLEEQRRLASLLVYAALAHRDPGDTLGARDDQANTDDYVPDGLAQALWLRHTRPDGSKAEGAHPQTPTPEEIVTRMPEDIMSVHRWTDLAAEARGEPSGGHEGPRPAGPGLPEPPPF